MDRNDGRNSRSLADLVGDLMRDAVILVRQEIQLAKRETSEKISHVGAAIAAMAVAGLVVFAGFLVLLDAAVYFIVDYFAPDVPLWLSALVVGALITSVGLAVLFKARSTLDPDSFIPRRSLRSIERDQDLIKEKLQ